MAKVELFGLLSWRAFSIVAAERAFLTIMGRSVTSFFTIMECFVPESDVRQSNVARAMSGFPIVAVEYLVCVHGHCVVLSELRVDDVVVSGAVAPRNTCLF